MIKFSYTILPDILNVVEIKDADTVFIEVNGQRFSVSENMNNGKLRLATYSGQLHLECVAANCVLATEVR